MDEIITIGLDVAKGVFHAVGRDAAGVKLFSRQLRPAVRWRVSSLRHAPCVVVMEACVERPRLGVVGWRRWAAG